MGDRATKDALFAQFAAVGKVLGNPTRLELLDLLAQGPRSVDDLAIAAQVGISTCSAHLQTLREAGLVDTRREGKRIFYSVGPPASSRAAIPPATRPRTERRRATDGVLEWKLAGLPVETAA